MRKIFLGASALLVLLSGCSKNELVDGPNTTQNDGKVRFAATSNRPVSRAATGNPITNTQGLQDNVKEFKVNGYVGSETAALVDATVKWTGASWEYDNEPYWPSATMNFFAYANWPTTGVPAITNTGITATGVTIDEDVLGDTGQKDLLVAATKGASKEVRTLVTFKHALTQIVFKAGNLDDTKLKVRIGGLRIVNVAKTGNMTVAPPTATTGMDAVITWNGHTAIATTTPQYHVQGLQVIADGGFTTPPAASGAFEVGPVTPTTAYTDAAYKQVQTAVTGNNALMLVPQTFTAWNPNGGTGEKPAVTTKAYIELLAIINHPDKTSTDLAKGDEAYYYCGTPVQGADGAADIYGKIYIPIESKDADMNEWIPGKRISYIITFGDTGSGSGGGGYDEDNEPVLVPIKFKATVEDWVNVDIPLLTASFNASSDDIKAGFINGFTNQLLNDIAAAREEKTYRANITISGTLNATDGAAITFAPTAVETKIAAGSIVTYNFTGITNWNSKTISMTVPTGWKAASYLNAGTTAVSEIAAGSSISVEGTNANKIVLTKL